MAWQDELREASFRGAAFVVSTAGGDLGRRVAEHDYPQRDEGWTEDLGRRRRELRVTGWVSGPDYMVARNAVLRAVELPGPGKLVHPFHGEQAVVCKEHSYEESAEAGGMCTFSFVFVEPGRLAFPEGFVGASLVADVADLAQLASLADFLSIFDLLLWPGEVFLAALEACRSIVQGVRKAIFGPAWKLVAQFDQIGATIDALQRDLEQLVNEPGELARRFEEVLGLVDDRAQAQAVLGTLASPDVEVTVPGPGTPSQRQIARNAKAVETFVRRTALVRVARLAVAEEPASLDDAVVLRDLVAGLLTAEAEAVGGETLEADELFEALTDLRTAVVEAIDAASVDRARLRTVTPAAPVPSLVLAWDLYGDVSREGEILARNRVAHPAFVPAAPLQVLEA